MGRIRRWLGMVIVLLAATGTVAAAGQYAWADHAKPYSFLFGNHIDTHQQSKLTDSGKLAGFFYIRFTGMETAAGVPEATHADCGQVGDACQVGWLLQGTPMRGTLLAHHEDEHPTWCVPEAGPYLARGFSHFHWLGAPDHAHGLTVGQTVDGYLLRLVAQQPFFFRHHGGFDIEPGVDVISHANVVADCEQ